MARTERFHAKTEGELVKLLAEKREALRTLRFSAAGARATDPDAPRKTRKEIARIRTELTKKHKAA
ncbi:MAG: 50S ribosomal protein L29 [Patescibacteria group bacterium]|nr:50S ribosomal protein L29 [Patescibacteria group bacterium]MDE1966389.1 50S ribosomal protein L29 [Patescibacteria group bacterium]